MLFAFCVYMTPLIFFWAVFLAIKKMIPLRVGTYGTQLMLVGTVLWVMLSLVFSAMMVSP